MLRLKPKVVVVSGNTATGKSALAQVLDDRFGFRVFRTKDYLKARLGPRLPTRANLINMGEEMDARDGGRWIAVAIDSIISQWSAKRVCVDRIRKPQQLLHIRAQPWGIFHAHFVASPAVLQERFLNRRPDAYLEDLSFDQVVESDARFDAALRQVSDAVFDTEDMQIVDIAAQLATRLRL